MGVNAAFVFLETVWCVLTLHYFRSVEETDCYSLDSVSETITIWFAWIELTVLAIGFIAVITGITMFFNNPKARHSFMRGIKSVVNGRSSS